MANYIRYVDEDWHKNDKRIRTEVRKLYCQTLKLYREVAMQKLVGKAF